VKALEQKTLEAAILSMTQAAMEGPIGQRVYVTNLHEILYYNKLNLDSSKKLGEN
jgi:hypothetical protein